jgi:glycosyltransferase involved in cell wall biosynthesis
MRSSRGTVAVFCNTFLPYSQTFVWDEVRCHERYAVEIFAWRRRNARLFPADVLVARPWYPLTCHDRRFAARFQRGGIDIVHAHFGWAGVPASRFARRSGVPLVVTFHGYDVALLTARGYGPPVVWPYTMRARELLAAMELGLCASAEIVEMLAAVGVPRDKLIEHRLGVDVERFRPGQRDADGLHVAMVGRLVEKKGFLDGLLAFARLIRSGYVAARLSIVGTGHLESALRNSAQELGIDGNVDFLGQLRHEAVAELLGRTDVLLAPSAVAPDGDRDSGLLSVKEASATGCVPVSTRHGGIPSIVDHAVTGFLVDEHDVEGMAAHLELLARDLPLRNRLGAAARAKMVRQFGLPASVRRLEECYDMAIDRHARRL